MLDFILFPLGSLLLILSYVSAQYHFKSSITCFKKYEYEETRSERLNSTLIHWYSESMITRRFTKEGLCSVIGCACFSYQRICSYTTLAYNHFSQCTTKDRQNGIIKWHRGVISNLTCHEMHQYPYIYLNLTCCYTDRCNDQPGKITKLVDTSVSSQLRNINISRTQQILSTTHKPRQFDSTSLSVNNSLSSNTFSRWMIVFILIIFDFVMD